MNARSTKGQGEKIRASRKTASGEVSLPMVAINMAMTADGKIATANRAVSSFGSRRDHDHLLELRATADAVMAGARTVDSAEVTLGPGAMKYRRARIKRGLAEFNLRIIASREGTVNPAAEIFKHRFSPIIILTTSRVSAARLKQLRTLADEVKICGRKEINFRRALSWLRQKWNVKRLLCEGGGELNDALFREGLVDELHLTICPKIFGGRDAPTIADGTGNLKLSNAAQFNITSRKQIGDELFIVAQVSKPAVSRTSRSAEREAVLTRKRFSNRADHARSAIP